MWTLMVHICGQMSTYVDNQIWSPPSVHVCGRPISQKPLLLWYWLKNIWNQTKFPDHPEKMGFLPLLLLYVVLNGLRGIKNWSLRSGGALTCFHTCRRLTNQHSATTSHFRESPSRVKVCSTSLSLKPALTTELNFPVIKAGYCQAMSLMTWFW